MRGVQHLSRPASMSEYAGQVRQNSRKSQAALQATFQEKHPNQKQLQANHLRPMISNWLAAALARRNIHYGWVMVGVTFFTALISAGTVGAPGVFIVPLQHEFGWTTAEISSALSIRFILFGLMAPFAAALLNRYGLRNVTLSAQLIVVSAL